MLSTLCGGELTCTCRRTNRVIKLAKCANKPTCPVRGFASVPPHAAYVRMPYAHVAHETPSKIGAQLVPCMHAAGQPAHAQAP